MEGFLFKKARGESMFGRHNWKLRWFMLESTSLSYFESFDTSYSKPHDVKGIYPCDGCVIEDISHEDFGNAFVLKYPNRKPLMLAAETENLKKLWVRAIEEASQLKPGQVSDLSELMEYSIIVCFGKVLGGAVLDTSANRGAILEHL